MNGDITTTYTLTIPAELLPVTITVAGAPESGRLPGPTTGTPEPGESGHGA